MERHGTQHNWKVISPGSTLLTNSSVWLAVVLREGIICLTRGCGECVAWRCYCCCCCCSCCCIHCFVVLLCGVCQIPGRCLFLMQNEMTLKCRPQLASGERQPLLPKQHRTASLKELTKGGDTEVQHWAIRLDKGKTTQRQDTNKLI